MNNAYPTKWKVSKNVDKYQVWRQIRDLHPGEPMNAAVREYYPGASFATKEEAVEVAQGLNEEGATA